MDKYLLSAGHERRDVVHNVQEAVPAGQGIVHSEQNVDQGDQRAHHTNQNDVQCALDRHAFLFDTLERSPLTHEQRIAAVTMADRNLLIAAAGSGKTSSMVGKVAYAVCSGMYAARQILVLAFNRKAALELDVRLRQCLAPFVPAGTRVKARTLHALGLEIVTQVKGYRPEVQKAGTTLLHQVLARLVHDDIDFAERWLLFRIFYHVTVRHPDQFDTRRQWKTFVRQHGEYRGRRYGFLTVRDELVPTQFEQAVANWLLLHNIDYVYTSLSCMAAARRRLGGKFPRPLSGQAGFLLSTSNRYVVCIGNTTQAVPRMKKFIYVTVDMLRDGTVFQYLRTQICPCKTAMKPGRMSAVLARIGQRLTPGQTDFLARFIRLARLGRNEPGQLVSRASAGPDPERATLHAPMLAQLLSACNAALEDTGTIDFEGMLHCAADYLDDGHYTHAYTLILVDEFQDTSQAGLRLLKSLLAQNGNCKLFAVGDDWQSIYRFAGAVPDVLSRFEQHFGVSAVNHLSATFRFNQSIADAASCFIQVNPAQLRKRVQARQDDGGASIVLGRYSTTPHMFALCKMCLSDSLSTLATFSGIPDEHGKIGSVYILGRYQHQRPPDLERWQQRFAQLDIEYQTVHSAKGLEADVVIVLGLQAGRHGFPAQVHDDPLITLVMPALEDFPHAEERRLFYVAITRSRQRVYLLADAQQPSVFVTELIELVRAGCDAGLPSISPGSLFQRLC